MISKKFTALEHEGAEVILEYNEDWVAAHLGADTKITPSTYEWIKTKLIDLNDFVETIALPPLMAAVDENNEPLNKFVEQMGFVYAQNLQNMNVYVYGGIK